jgi:hypothetical protein
MMCVKRGRGRSLEKTRPFLFFFWPLFTNLGEGCSRKSQRFEYLYKPCIATDYAILSR